MAIRLNSTSFFSLKSTDSFKNLFKGKSIQTSALFAIIIALLLLIFAVFVPSLQSSILIVAVLESVLLVILATATIRGRILAYKQHFEFSQQLMAQKSIYETVKILDSLPDDYIYFSNATLTLSGHKKVFDFVVIGPTGIYFIICIGAENKISVEYKKINLYNDVLPEMPYQSVDIWTPEQFVEVQNNISQWLDTYSTTEKMPFKIVIIADSPKVESKVKNPIDIIRIDNFSNNWFQKNAPFLDVIPETAIRSIFNNLVGKTEQNLPLHIKENSSREIAIDKNVEKILSKAKKAKNMESKKQIVPMKVKTHIKTSTGMIDNLLFYFSKIVNLLSKLAIIILVLSIILAGTIYLAFKFQDKMPQEITPILAQIKQLIPPKAFDLLGLIYTIQYENIVTYGVISGNAEVYETPGLNKKVLSYLAPNQRVTLLNQQLKDKVFWLYIVCGSNKPVKGWVNSQNIKADVILKRKAKIYKYIPAKANQSPAILNDMVQPVILLQKNIFPHGKQSYFKIHLLGDEHPYWVKTNDVFLRKNP